MPSLILCEELKKLALFHSDEEGKCTYSSNLKKKNDQEKSLLEEIARECTVISSLL